jgi:hypothetical protein
MSIISPLGVCVIDPPGENYPRTINYPAYIYEILSHAGMCYYPIDAAGIESALPDLRILVTVGDASDEDFPAEALRSWVFNGGCWISIGGTCGLSDLLGVERVLPPFRPYGTEIACLGEGYMHVPVTPHRVLDHVNIPLHYFGGIKLTETTAEVLARTSDAHQRETGFAAVAENRVGRGRTIVIAPDICGTVVRIQQGTAVTRDGIAADDGLGSCDDRLLKSEDGIVLDWIFDRREVPGVPGFNAFLEPIADQWREVVIRSILHMAASAEVYLPILWLYPHAAPAIAHLSHDSDANDEDLAAAMLRVLDKTNVHSTWCIVSPGYSKEMIRRIRAEGHELAMHYDAFEIGAWSEEEFQKQVNEITDLFDGTPPTSNKNHYLRWEGDMEFFEWCARIGIKIDGSKGATKIGEAGLCFGTCHPHFPIAWSEEIIDVLELPTFMFDLVEYIPKEIMPPLVGGVLAQHGVLHLLFHPAHIAKPGVEDALVEAVRMTREAGMEWYTAEEISDWERARREFAWKEYADGSDGVKVRFCSEKDMPGLTMMWLAPDESSAVMNGNRVSALELERWGFRFKGVDFDATEGSEYILEIKR